MIMIDKKTIRKEMLAKRNTMDRESVSELSRRICENIRSLSEYQSSEIILSYYPKGNEMDTRPLFTDAKRFYLPRVDKKEMKLFRYLGEDSLATGAFGIKEPKSDEAVPYINAAYGTALHKNDFKEDDSHKKNSHEAVPKEAGCPRSILMIMPGLAFDIYGGRAGYGAGFYDRYLAEHKDDNIIKVAAAFSFQVIDDRLLCDEYDIKPDILVTENSIIQIHDSF